MSIRLSYARKLSSDTLSEILSNLVEVTVDKTGTSVGCRV